MIRGAIDNVTPHEISGWIYGGDQSLRGRKILAFFEDTCIGAGEVKEFRQDLVDAGLGDGFHGFHFEITPPEKNRLGGVVIRLEGDDATVIQKDSRIVGRFDPPELSAGTGTGLNRAPLLQWMRGRRWLDQSQFDFLWYLDQLGIYNRMLTDAEQAHIAEVEKGSIAVDLLELFHMAEIVPACQPIHSAAQLTELLRRVVTVTTLEPVVAVWSVASSRFRLVEGSHRDASRRADKPGAMDGAFTNYVLGPNRLLFFNSRCQFDGMIGSQGVTAFFASGLRD